MTANPSDVFIGIDSGTQSTKALLVDGDTGRVLAAASAPHEVIPGLPPGHLEQHPADWFTAMEQALLVVLKDRGIDRSRVRAIGVSGQQHGLVALDAAGRVIRPAKLWCDTSTAAQCEQILARVGGLERYIELTGNGLPPGFTASKIAWLKECEPHHYARLHTVLLPHDYLNFRLTGRRCMECGDASGTALFDVRRRTWCRAVIDAIDAGAPGQSTGLIHRLPPLLRPDESCGTLLPELAARWHLPADVLVAPGSGDNMMSAIGTGNVTEGVVTVSLGTSGTIFAYSSSPIVDPAGEVAAFCDSTGAWLPLVCTMNVTVATEWTRSLFGLDVAAFEQAVARTPPGSDGLLLIPYFDGERTPNVPNGTGVWFGARRGTNTPGHFARAAMEGATLGLARGFRRLVELGLRPREIRLTGGGSNSPAWRQIVSNVFNLPVVCLAQSESAAFGAALQAKWCWEKQRRPEASMQETTNAWVRPVERTRKLPDAHCAEVYRRLATLHDRLSAVLRSTFEEHRSLSRTLFEPKEPRP